MRDDTVQAKSLRCMIQPLMHDNLGQETHMFDIHVPDQEYYVLFTVSCVSRSRLLSA